MRQMPKGNRKNFLEEKKAFVERLSSVFFIVPVLLASLTIGTIIWVITINNLKTTGNLGACFAGWVIINMAVFTFVYGLSYPFYILVDSSICSLVNSISNFKNIPSFTESLKLSILLLVYGYRIRKFVSGGVITDLVIDDRIKHAHKKVEDILSEPAVVDVIKRGKSRHFKKDVVASVAEVIKGAIQEVYEISRNANIENRNKVKKQNEESEQMVTEFLTRKK